MWNRDVDAWIYRDIYIQLFTCLVSDYSVVAESRMRQNIIRGVDGWKG
jgi:hypothetical protein